MATIADIVADARRMAYGSMNEQINVVAQNYTASANTLYLELDVSGITPGTVLSSGLNVWYVKGLSSTDKAIYVIPGYDNSPQEAASIGDIVYIKPKVTTWFLFSAVNDEIRKLSSPTNGLYQIGTWTENVSPTYQTYEVPPQAEGMINLLRVRYRSPGTPNVWIPIRPYSYQWKVTESANLIQMLTNVPSGTEIEFTYKAPFTEATSLSDDPVVDCGLSPTMLDLPALGAAVTLLRTSDGRRNQIGTQGDPRRAEEVQSSANLATAAAFDRDYKARVNDELARLLQRNPIYMGV